MDIIYQTIASGIISSLVVLFVSNHFKRKDEKKNVIAELLGSSYQLVKGGSKEKIASTLNKSYLVFYDSKAVINSLEIFKNSLGIKPTEETNELFLNVINSMCKSVGVKFNNINNDTFLRPFS